MKGKRFNDIHTHRHFPSLYKSKKSNELLKGKYACEMQTLRKCITFDWQRQQLRQRDREEREREGKVGKVGKTKVFGACLAAYRSADNAHLPTRTLMRGNRL